MDQQKIALSIVIPTYNEAQNIGNTLSEIAKYCHDKLNTLEVIVVDADSPDNTAQLASKKAKLFTHFKVISAGPKPPKKAIKGLQVKQGVLQAKGEYIMFMDADLATPLKYLQDVFDMMKNNSQVAICTRDLGESHKGLRKLISTAGNFVIQLLILPGIKDTQCGFKAFEGQVAKKVFTAQTISGWGFDMEILAIARKFGYRIDIIHVPDWKDVAHNDTDSQKLSSSKFSAMRAALQTLPDVIKIKWKLLRGAYKKVGA